MIAQLLKSEGMDAYNAPAKLGAGELIKLVDEVNADAVCVSVVAPSTIIHARYLCAKLRAQSAGVENRCRALGCNRKLGTGGPTVARFRCQRNSYDAG